MLFNSYVFIFAFLPAVLAGFFLLRRQEHRLVFVIVASYVFYGWAEAWFPALMAGSTVMSFAAGQAVARAGDDRRRRLYLAAGIVGVLGLLVYFKYATFFGNNASDLVSLFNGGGWPGVRQFVRGIVLPVGISFYTFEAISYMVDVYRGTIPAERNPLRYAYFISFFPHLIAGPIVRYAKLKPQLEQRYRFDLDLFMSGLLLFSLGLVKKVVIADRLATTTNELLLAPGSLGFVGSWLTMFGYAFQIYFDFSGYCDMALGLARMLGIELPWNFDRPYRAASPREFWRRWHVTLSSWLRDYVYIPLGGSRVGPLRRDFNLLATMGIGGLWHGASFNFVIWGLYHGGLLTAQHHLERLRWRPPRVVAVAFMFVLATVGWVFFRMRTTAGVQDVLLGMTGAHGLGLHDVSKLFVVELVLVGILMWGVKEEWRWQLGRVRPWKTALVGVATGVALVGIHLSTPFIYFQF